MSAAESRKPPDGPQPATEPPELHNATIADALFAARLDVQSALQQARDAEERLRDAIDILPQGVVFLDNDGRYVLWNRRYAEMYAGTADHFHVGAKFEDTLRIGLARGEYPEAIGNEEAWLKQRIDRLYSASGRHEQRLRDGRCILIEERRTSDGGIIGLRVDVTEMKEKEQSFRLLFESNPVPMFVHSVENDGILAVNDAAAEHYGYSPSELLGMRFGDLKLPVSEDAQACGPGMSVHRKASGESICVAIYSRRLTHEGQPAALIAVIDVTERQRAKQRIAYMVHHDVLTGLPNRVQFRERMADALKRLRRDEITAVLCIDIDDFKTVNDTFGHPVGDRLLQLVGERLRSQIRDNDSVARLGGDEFAVLQTGIAVPEDAGALATRLLSVIGAPFEIEGNIVSVGLSIGIAIGPGDGDDGIYLLKNADMALYRSKTEARGSFCFFASEMDARLQRRRMLEVGLRAAIAVGSLDVHYQPLVTLANEEISGFEALLRWTHPDKGDIAPGEFIPVAEETGLIGPLGAFVLNRACKDAMSWPENVNVAVNLSPLQFRAGNLFNVVVGALQTTGLSPRRLELEITETLLLEKSDQVLGTLHALRELGVRISMDDFGTGYSSLSYLRSFPFDKIKIDRSFVQDLDANPDSRAIVRAILSLGASLGITITAEGVETEDELACLKSEGCQEGQGFLFARAQPHETANLMVARNTLPPRIFRNAVHL